MFPRTVDGRKEGRAVCESKVRWKRRGSRMSGMGKVKLYYERREGGGLRNKA